MYVASSRRKAFDYVQSNARNYEVQSTQEIEKGFIEVTVNGTTLIPADHIKKVIIEHIEVF